MREIYDEFAATYDANRGQFDMSEILDSYWRRLDQPRGKLLDLGCGAGEPFAKWFADRAWDVTGVDFSRKMLQLAAKYVPRMETIQADMRAVDFNSGVFDAITGIYSLFHIPVNDQQALFKKAYGWLRPGGKMLFTYATKDYTGSERFEGFKEFMGRRLFYAHATPPELKNGLEKIGFKIEDKRYHFLGGETFLWVTISKFEGGA